MKVKYNQEAPMLGLTPDKIYIVLGTLSHEYSIINDHGNKEWYPSHWFDKI